MKCLTGTSSVGSRYQPGGEGDSLAFPRAHPKIYREPLVLFYREHQSIEVVAHDLGLSEDAVKQRLARAEAVAGAISRLCRRRSPTNESGQTFALVCGGTAVAGNFSQSRHCFRRHTKGGSAVKVATGAGMFGRFCRVGGADTPLFVRVFGLLAGILVANGACPPASFLGRKRIIHSGSALAFGFLLLVCPDVGSIR